MKSMWDFIAKNRVELFNAKSNSNKVILDSKGFSLSEKAKPVYKAIKDEPHLYVAFTMISRTAYVGRSFQKGGRWQRNRYYHLGALSNDLFGTRGGDGQNHLHWLEAWMKLETYDQDKRSIEMKEPVYISFVPFSEYGPKDFSQMDEKDIREINKTQEKLLINEMRSLGFSLLNVQLT